MNNSDSKYMRAVMKNARNQKLDEIPDGLKYGYEKKFNFEPRELTDEENKRIEQILESIPKTDWLLPSQFSPSWEDMFIKKRKEFENALQYPNAAINFIHKDPKNIGMFPAEKQTDTLVTLAIVSDPSTLMLIKNDEMRKSKYQLAVSRDGMLLEKIPSEEQNFEIGLAAVENNGEAAQFLRDDLKNPVLERISEDNGPISRM